MIMENTKKEYEIEKALKFACNSDFGPLAGSFMCQSIGCIDPNDAVSLNKSSTLAEVVDTLKIHKTGCIQLVNDKDELKGIFSERDWILKIANKGLSLNDGIEKYMTKDPVTITMEASIAYAINLMSSGGFRHLPIVDGDNSPVGMLSVKNILDHMANSALTELMDV